MSISDLVLLGEDACGGLLPIVVIVAKVIKFFSIVIPIALIIFGTIDLGKAVIASDEKEVKAGQGRLIKRFIYAALVFFVPILVTVLMDLVAAGDSANTNSTDKINTTGWSDCYNAARNYGSSGNSDD